MVTKSKLTPEDREKAGRRPIPKTSRAWMAEIEGVQRFVEKRPSLKEGNGKAWFDSMRSYYLARLRLLAEEPPKNMPKVASSAIVAQVLKDLT